MKTLKSILLLYIVGASLPALHAQTVIKVVQGYVLIDRDRGIGEKNDKVFVCRVKDGRIVDVGKVQIVKFEGGKTAAKIIDEERTMSVFVNGTIPLMIIISLTVGVFCMCRSSEPVSQEEALAEIKKLHERDMAAAKVLDIETLIALWTEDGVLLQPNQEPLVGREVIWSYMQDVLEEQKKYEITEYVHHFEEIKIMGDWAYEWGTFHGAFRPLAGGEEIRQRSRLFRILRRQPDGAWKCARAIWHELPVEAGR